MLFASFYFYSSDYFEHYLCYFSAVMQHRMMKEAQRAMSPWMNGQQIYAPLSHMSSQMNPALYPGKQTTYLLLLLTDSSICFVLLL